jgi:hypothetical protein
MYETILKEISKINEEKIQRLNQEIEQLFNELQQFNLNFDNYEKN